FINLSDYYQWAIDETSYRPPGTREPPGVFGITTRVDLRVLYSNANLLRQEGLVDSITGEPRPPQTWTELRQYANSLTRYKNGNRAQGIERLGLAPNYGNSWLYMYAWQAGGDRMNAQPTGLTLRS